MNKSKIGLIGLGVMGANLARNIASKGFQCSVYNRTVEKTDKFVTEYGSEKLLGKKTLAEFVDSLEVPRQIIIMVNAGKPVDAVIADLLPLLDQGDLLIDTGNSNYHDTKRRHTDLQAQGFKFLGCGVSGGEEGALHGPSMMPGGDREAYEMVREIFEAIAARDFSGGACISYIGDDGAGHYVKMVHNGIEYGIMQVMAEVYDLLSRRYRLSATEIADIFERYDQGKLKSYLFEIAVKVLRQSDDLGEGQVIDAILDRAVGKGTGRWTALDAIERGIAPTSIVGALFARYMSEDKSSRTKLAQTYQHQMPTVEIDEILIGKLEEAIYAAVLLVYAQGYQLIQSAAQAESWQIDLGEISRIWEGGCIIRADLLQTLHQSYGASSTSDMLEIPEIVTALQASLPSLRLIAADALLFGIPTPSLGGALAYFDSVTAERLPANFIQGLRDYFGAHTYERLDREGSFHTHWEDSEGMQNEK